jgi:hypothetical protein
MTRLRIWREDRSFSTAETLWDQGEIEAKNKIQLKELKNFPDIPGITAETKKGLKWKSLKWMFQQDLEGNVVRAFLRKPFKHCFRLLISYLKGVSYIREGDFFLYGLSNFKQFETLLKKPEVLFVLGFSYCHKPFECPSGRFSPNCIHDSENLVCRQCFIGKAINALPSKNTVFYAIPTVHYIGGKIFELIEKNPKKEIVFLITACEMTLEMFGDYGYMAGVRGIGVRLDGRICNTIKAFQLSEKGIKPGLTVVLNETKQKIMEWIRILWEERHSS